MKHIIAEIRALIAEESVTTYFVDVPEKPSFPYVLVWASPGREVTSSLSGDDDHISDIIGLTYVAELPESVLDLAAVVRPLVRRARLDLGGFVAWLRPHDSQPVDMDRSVSLPGGGNPAFAVDLLRVISDGQPLGSS